MSGASFLQEVRQILEFMDSGSTAFEACRPSLLDDLGYPELDAMSESERSNLHALCRFSQNLAEFFPTRVATMPGLSLFTAMRNLNQDPTICVSQEPSKNILGYSGRGISHRQSFESCLGEAIERDAMLKRIDDRRLNAIGSDTLMDLSDPISVSRYSSTGLAAGPTLKGAEMNSLRECHERDAVARWFVHGQELGEITKSPGLLSLEKALRREEQITTRFFLIRPIEKGLPVVIAQSHFNDFVVNGFGCDLSIEAACKAALIELGQGEYFLLNERQRKNPPRNGFIAKSAFFIDGKFFKPTFEIEAVKELSFTARTVEYVEISREDVGVPVVRGSLMRGLDISYLIGDGEISPI